MNTPYPVRLEKGHVIMSDHSTLSPAVIRELVQSLGKNKRRSETYPVKIEAYDGQRSVITNHKDRIDGKLLGAVSRAGKHMQPRETMRFDDSQYDAYGRFKDSYESFDQGRPHPPPRETYSTEADFQRRRDEYERRGETYDTSYNNKLPYAYDTTPSPFHSIGGKYFPVSQAYGS